MNAVEIICAVVLLVACAVIIAFTLMQAPKGQGLSGAIMGDAGGMMNMGRARSNDAKMAKLTMVCMGIFFVVSLVVCVVSARMG